MRVFEVPLPAGWSPYAVAGDAEGAVWTTLLTPAGLARPAPGQAAGREPSRAGHGPGAAVEHEALPAGFGQPMLLAPAADGSLWYTGTGDRIGRRDPGGTHTTIELPAGSAPYGIAAADDGVWFTAPGLDRIGRTGPDGALTWFDLPVRQARAAMLAVDRQGSVWAALNGASALARLRDGRVEVVELPAGSAPVGVVAASDGVWYADIAGGCVGRVTAGGAVERVGFGDPACRPHAVAAGGDGGCWVTLWGSGELARVAAAGEVTTVALPGREPHGLWVSDRRVWVAMESGSLVRVDR